LPADAHTLAQLARQTFCETFSHYDPAALEAFLREHYSPENFSAQLADTSCELWIAQSNGQPVAYAKWGAYKLPLAPSYERVVELHRLYVLRSHHGRKIGHLLMEKALRYAADNRAQAIYLGVWSLNRKAQGFYGRYGFVKVGEYDYPPVGEVVDREWIMMRECGE
jgi:ribosomal protein S18 acetylase RimI-like enzyme